MLNWKFNKFVYYISETYFFVKWKDKDKDGDDLYDVVNAKLVCASEDQPDVLKIVSGSECTITFHGQPYVAEVVAVGE